MALENEDWSNAQETEKRSVYPRADSILEEYRRYEKQAVKDWEESHALCKECIKILRKQRG